MKRILPFLSILFSVLGLGAASSAQVGSVLRAQRIKPGSAGFVGPLTQYEGFGSALAALGDVNGDGVGDLAVGAPYDADGGLTRGAVWILFLKTDGSVLGEQKISQTQGGFTGALNDQGNFGRDLAGVGDLDGDGVPELAVLSSRPNRLWILFLNANGTLKSHAEDLFSDPVFVPPTQPENFYYGGVTALGDLDGDGLCDLALGSPRDSDGAFEAGALWIVRLNADGTLKAAQKISQTQGGFGGTLAEESYFGAEIVQLGDLDGDGNRELGVVSPFAPFLGGMWLLFLDASGHVLAQRSFDSGDYGLLWPRPDGSLDGTATSRVLAWLGDLDGDGRGELAAGFPGDFPGASDGIAIDFLRADGSVRKKLRIGDERGGLGDLPRDSYLGSSLAVLGDLDRDGTIELAVGAPNERAAGVNGGGAWIVSLDPSAARDGSGANPALLSQASEPVFGTSWALTLDCSAHASGLAFVFGASRPAAGTFSAFGERLVAGTPLFRALAPHLAGPTPLSIAVPPYDVALLDLPLFVQGLCTGAPGPRLSNALDVLVGR